MHILCTICSDLVNQAESLYVTKCGHIFHYQCLAQWIERSKSCPQCRNKVTDKCMFRMYPTISNDTTVVEDATTLQSRLDDAHLQLRQQRADCKERDEKITVLSADLKKNEDIIKSHEKKLIARESAVAAMKEQLLYLKVQNQETQRLREDNEALQKSMATLTGLQKVLNATSAEAESMLESYSDAKTIATFATALKRALCESESKKSESRDKALRAQQLLAVERTRVTQLNAKLSHLEEKLALAEARNSELCGKRKRKESLDKSCSTEEDHRPATAATIGDYPDRFNDAILLQDTNSSFNSAVRRIEQAESPYLALQRGSLALATLSRAQPKSTESAKVKSVLDAFKKQPDKATKLSIFHKKEPARVTFDSDRDMNLSQLNVSYDGLGGHSKLDEFPKAVGPPLRTLIPKLSAKHRLKRPSPAGSLDIRTMMGSLE